MIRYTKLHVLTSAPLRRNFYRHKVTRDRECDRRQCIDNEEAGN